MEFSFKNCEEFHKYCWKKECAECCYKRFCIYWTNGAASRLVYPDDPIVFETLQRHFRKKKLEKLLS